MIYVDLVDGNVAIDWERYDRLRTENRYLSQRFRFTHQVIASLEGTPSDKLTQLERLLGCSAVYDFVQKEGIFCCRATWQDRRGYGVSGCSFEALTLAQADLLSILCDYPIDAYRDNETWDEFSKWDA